MGKVMKEVPGQEGYGGDYERGYGKGNGKGWSKAQIP